MNGITAEDPSAPLVTKLGGSLFPQVTELVPILIASKRPLFIIPGGGKFADAVRNSGAGGDSAHWMAVAAMDQFGWFIASHGIPVTTELKIPDRPVVFLPYCSMRKLDPLPRTWDVTSDSIAAWAADHLGLDLLLLKSVDGIREKGRLAELIQAPVFTDVVDPYFIPFVLEKKIRTKIINGSRVETLERFLAGNSVRGTCICTTF